MPIKKVVFTNCGSEENNTQVDDAHDNGVIMSMYILTEYCDIIQKHQEVYGNTIKMNHL